MRGVYTVKYEIASLSVAKTLLLGTAPTTCILDILEAYVTNANQNTVEQLLFALSRVTTLGTPVGTAISAANVQPTEASSSNTGVTWTADLTTEPTTYNANPMHQEGVLNVQGYRFDAMPEARRIIPPGGSFGLRLLTAPTNAFKAEIILTYAERG